MILDKHAGIVQPQAGTLRDRLRRKEWIKEMRQMPGRNPHAVVLHREADTGQPRKLPVCVAQGLRRFRNGEPEEEPPTVRHGVGGVQRQVQHHLPEPNFIHIHRQLSRS